MLQQNFSLFGTLLSHCPALELQNQNIFIYFAPFIFEIVYAYAQSYGICDQLIHG